MTAHDLARDNPAFADADALQNLETVPFEPFGPNWIVAENQPCQLYNPDPEPGETIIWSGDCVNGTASGEGEVVWRGRYGVEVYEGEYRNGYEHGYGRFTWIDGNRYQGEWRDGQFHGRGSFAWADGDRYGGEWRAGKPHDRGILIASDGGGHEGEWHDGCFEENDRQAWVYTTAAECGFE